MSIDYNVAELAALASGVVSKGVFFRLATSPLVRLWLGAGKIRPGINALDAADGAEYLGCGEITDIPIYKQLLNGAAERVAFTMNGVSGKVLDIAAADSDQVLGKRIDIGVMLFAANWSPLGPVRWHASYTAGPISMRRQLTSDTSSPIVRTLSLSAGSPFTSRKRPNYSYWTDADQRDRHASDLFCSLAAQYTRNYSLPWPIYS